MKKKFKKSLEIFDKYRVEIEDKFVPCWEVEQISFILRGYIVNGKAIIVQIWADGNGFAVYNQSEK
jgi:hypothetical protein